MSPWVRLLVLTILVGVGGMTPRSARGEDPIDLSQFDPLTVDPWMGNYSGTFEMWGWEPARAETKVTPEGEDEYRIAIAVEAAPGDLWGIRGEFPGKREGGKISFRGNSGGVEWEGTIENGVLKGRFPGDYGGNFELHHDPSHSPTAGMAPPEGAIVLLPYSEGKTPDLSEWTNPNWIALPDGTMMVGKGSQSSKREFGDHRIHLEFATPYEPKLRGQGRGNSGMYIHSRYEAQILESHGLIQRGGDIGSFYQVAVPRTNAALPPLYWQTYDVTFRAARFHDDGSVSEHPWITVVLNGVTIHDRRVFEGPTAGGAPGAVAKAPLHLQDHGNKVRFRNVWVVEEEIP